MKKRINITADVDVEEALIRAAKRDSLSVTTKATELLRIALELEEDLILGSIADERLSQKVKYLTYEKIWE